MLASDLARLERLNKEVAQAAKLENEARKLRLAIEKERDKLRKELGHGP